MNLENLEKAPIPYRNNVIKQQQKKETKKITAPIPYRNNVIVYVS